MNIETRSRSLIPATLDIHTHLRDLGQGHKEDFHTGTSAALAGGNSTIFDMPNKFKAIFTVPDLIREIKEAETKIVCDIGFYLGSDGKNLTEFERAGKFAMGLKVYLNETTGNLKLDNPNDLEKIYNAWPGSAGPILLHAENEMVPFSLAIAKKTEKRTHICHVSTKESMQQIIKAKLEKVPVTCGVTPHHLFMTKEDVKRLGSFAYMKPELETQEDVDFLWKNLSFVDVIESDHAPHTIEEKESAKPPSGVPGLETTLPLMLTAVSEGKLSLSRLLELVSINPRKIFGLKLPASTHTIVDLNQKYTLTNENLKTKCGWTPFAGKEVQGKVKSVFVRGQKVFEDGEVLAKPGSGRVIYPA